MYNQLTIARQEQSHDVHEQNHEEFQRKECLPECSGIRSFRSLFENALLVTCERHLSKG